MARKILFVIHGIAQRAPDDATDKPRTAADTWFVDLVDNVTALAAKHSPGVDIGLTPGADGVNERGQSLIDAVYAAIGYRRVDDGGPWYA